MSGNGAKSIFFSKLAKAWIPAFAGMTVVVRGVFFLLKGEICVLQWLPEQGNRRARKLRLTKFVSSDPFLGRTPPILDLRPR